MNKNLVPKNTKLLTRKKKLCFILVLVFKTRLQYVYLYKLYLYVRDIYKKKL